MYQDTEAKLAPIMTDGKITGFRGAGSGTFRLAVGGAASLAKTWTYTIKSTELGQYTVEHSGE